jgi:hypothetical protein
MFDTHHRHERMPSCRIRRQVYFQDPPNITDLPQAV